MPTIIDSLLLKIGVDTSGAKKGATEAGYQYARTRENAKKTADDLDKNGAKGAKFFTQMSVEAAKLLLLFKGASGVEGMIKSLIGSTAQLGLNASNLDMSTDELARWQNMAVRMGGTADGLVSTLSKISQAQTEFAVTGQSSTLPWLRTMGITLEDGQGKLRNYADILRDMHNWFMQMESAGHSRREMFNMGAMFGIDQGTLNLLLLGNKEFENEIALQQRVVHGQEAASKAALLLQQRVQLMRQKFIQWAQDLLVRVAPKLERLLDLMMKFADWCSTHQSFVVGFFAAVAVAAAAALAPIIASYAGILAMAAAVGGLATLLSPEWDKIGKAGVDVGRLINDAWHGDFDSMRSDLAKLKDDLKSLWDDFKETRVGKWLDSATKDWQDSVQAKLHPEDKTLRFNRPEDQVKESPSWWSEWRKESRINAMVKGVDHPKATPEERAEANRRIQKKREEAAAQPKADTGFKWLDKLIDSFSNFGNVLDDTSNQLATTSGMIQAMNNSYYETGDRTGVIQRSTGGSTTSVQVDKIEVHTPTNDPVRQGNSVADAMKRKLISGHANSGMR